MINMIYLHHFNESNSEDYLRDLNEFFEIHLAYLIDDGLQFNIRPHFTNKEQEQQWSNNKLCHVELVWNNLVSWDSIKDSIITFFTHLSRSYTVPLFGELPSLTTQEPSRGLPPIPPAIRGSQISLYYNDPNKKWIVTAGMVTHSSKPTGKLILRISDLDSTDKMVGLYRDGVSVHSISFYVCEVPFISSNVTIGSRLKKYLGF